MGLCYIVYTNLNYIVYTGLNYIVYTGLNYIAYIGSAIELSELNIPHVLKILTYEYL